MREIILRILTISVIISMIVLSGCTNSDDPDSNSAASAANTKEEIEEALDLSNMNAEWTYSEESNAWTLTPVTAVTDPEIEDEQGVSVCVPGAYVKGIDTDGDGEADETSKTVSASVTGDLVIDHDATITSTNGQVYTADSAPVIVNTGAAGYSEQQNQTAQATYAEEGYINVVCGNRGKQSTTTDDRGESAYTGDAPSCLVDQKNAVRFVKYNILLGNLPGSVNYFVSTGGSGGGAHAVMLAATSDNSDYYAYEAEAGAVGVYKDGDSYVTTVTIDGEETELSDGMWGCMAYSAITSLQEADMAMAFEYYLDTDYDFNTDFQKQMAEYLSEEYMNYINDKDLSIEEKAAGFDLDGDSKLESTVDLKIEYDEEKYKDTNGYGGTYLDLYLAEFQQSLADYLDRLDYADSWTWFDSDGKALSDDEVTEMTIEDKAKAFVEGRYAKGTDSSENSMNGIPDMMNGQAAEGQNGQMPEGQAPDGQSGPQNGEIPNGGTPPDMHNKDGDQGDTQNDSGEVGTPDAGTTQSAGSSTDSANYDSYEEMLKAYQEDIEGIQSGDQYGNNIVDLYDPLNYIGNDDTNDPTWTRILMGASEGDISMMSSLNMQIAWLNAGTDAEIEWQWDGGHVPSEILGDSLSLYVDTMYGEYVDGAVDIEKKQAEKQSENGDAEEATGTDISDWVSFDDGDVSFTLSDAASYRTAGAAKSIPGFDVMDYGQEDYVFGSSTQDARHWDKYVLKVMEENADTLKKLFN
ncbi:MAG: hypothetical protein IKF07_05075 [Eubacterium sp.]|nr:hypothetical protein [Eubacterium sp.]